MQEVKLSDIFEEKIIKETPTYFLVQRSFCKDLCEEELVWHRDKEDRDIFLVEGKGWYIQMENELPKLMTEGTSFEIPKYTWHRIINKNRTNLVIEIRKYK